MKLHSLLHSPAEKMLNRSKNMTAEREYKAVRIGKPKNPVRTAFLSFWTPKGEFYGRNIC